MLCGSHLGSQNSGEGSCVPSPAAPVFRECWKQRQQLVGNIHAQAPWIILSQGGLISVECLFYLSPRCNTWAEGYS